VLFRHRSWVPVPFVLLLMLFHGELDFTRSVVAAGLLALGEGWRIWAVAVAGTGTRRRGRRVRCLITGGPFGCHRNPLYAGNFLIWMAV
jgi:protein-S-isoprenylcysteine O-methyltransferase Ste14